ncbi:hypothetical protein Tco_0823883 [Tanacetum coccineum]|uniref:Uncharacterized protein n=1 Tax=Tanacetum coccineum TaxID=301880 RepID=A0ABQ5ANT2_9ASTR
MGSANYHAEALMGWFEEFAEGIPLKFYSKEEVLPRNPVELPGTQVENPTRILPSKAEKTQGKLQSAAQGHFWRKVNKLVEARYHARVYYHDDFSKPRLLSTTDIDWKVDSPYAGLPLQDASWSIQGGSYPSSRQSPPLNSNTQEGYEEGRLPLDTEAEELSR